MKDLVPCHCEDELSESVAIPLNYNEITTQTAFARNDGGGGTLSCNAAKQLNSQSLCDTSLTGKYNSFAQQTEMDHSPFTTHNSLKTAFTLAEVLITLGIIGIVAAMTLPTLITNHQKKQTAIQLKKVYSDLANALKLSEIDNGTMATWTYPFSSDNDTKADFIKKYYQPYFKGSNLIPRAESHYTGVQEDVMFGYPNHYLLLSNGVILGFHFSNYYFWLFADVDGYKGANKIGRDQFVFWFENGTAKLNFAGSGSSVSNMLDSRDGYACNPNNTNIYRNFACGLLIQINGWEIPEGYPW